MNSNTVTVDQDANFKKLGRRTILFLHIPRTGGITLRSILEQQYGTERVFAPHTIITRNAEKIAGLGLEDKTRLAAVVAHMPFGAHQYFDSAVYVTLIRDPVQTVLSSYFSVLRDPKKPYHDVVAGQQVSIRDFAASFANTMTKRLARYEFLDKRLWARKPLDAEARVDPAEGRPFKDIGPWTFEQALEQAKEHLDQFTVVGLNEEYETFVGMLAREFGWDGFDIPRLNARPPGPQPDEVDDDTLEFIRKINSLDMELYEHAKKLFAGLLAKFGVA